MQQVKNIEYYKPTENSEEIKYLKERRKQLGGFIPERSSQWQSLLKRHLKIYLKVL